VVSTIFSFLNIQTTLYRYKNFHTEQSLLGNYEYSYKKIDISEVKKKLSDNIKKSKKMEEIMRDAESGSHSQRKQVVKDKEDPGAALRILTVNSRMADH
jgi:hypothetical protein